MKIRRTGKALMFTAAAGAAAAYLLDPDSGQQRRDRLAERAKCRSSDVRDLASKANDVKDAVTGSADEESSADCPPGVPGVTSTNGDVPTQSVQDELAGRPKTGAGSTAGSAPDADDIGTDLSTGHRPL